MIIHLDKSELFTVDPSLRFAVEYKVDTKTWPEIWRRYKLLEYTVPELQEYLNICCGKKLMKKTIQRWIFRQEVYLISYKLLQKGTVTISTEIFKNYEKPIIDELLRHMKSGNSKTSESIV